MRDSVLICGAAFKKKKRETRRLYRPEVERLNSRDFDCEIFRNARLLLAEHASCKNKD
jgi:hypothetical protein